MNDHAPSTSTTSTTDGDWEAGARSSLDAADEGERLQDLIEDRAVADYVEARTADLDWIRGYAPEATARLDDVQALEFADCVLVEHEQYTAEVDADVVDEL